jgi:D-serine deaminase-like pyridoxal phosphate-dependent protein
MHAVATDLDQWIGARWDELDTPAPVIDLNVMEANIARQQETCDRLGLRFRPHIKTHKVPAIAMQQRAAGAQGITTQKTTEAQVFVEAGFDDLIVAVPAIGARKTARLCDLAERATVHAVVDSAEAARGIAQAASVRGVQIGLLIEVDSNAGRAGVQSGEEALSLARCIGDLPGVTLDGLFWYPSREDALPRIAEARAALDGANIPIRVMSGGGTGADALSAKAGATEHRSGTYVFNDMTCVRRGVATLDQCALTVVTTVVSTAVPGFVTVDGGSKTFTNDAPPSGDEGYGQVKDRPGLTLARMNEEHGIVACGAGESRPALGEKLRIIPNHACGCVNLHDVLYGLRDGVVESVWPIAARGTLQ